MTELVHLWSIPVVPLRSMLVDLGGTRIETRLSARSIAAAYATTWAPSGTMLFAKRPSHSDNERRTAREKGIRDSVNVNGHRFSRNSGSASPIGNACDLPVLSRF